MAGGTALALMGCGGSGSGSGAAAGRPVITARPAVGLFDAPRTIVVSHLRPGERITVHASTLRAAGTWTASATFRADGDGVVNLARSAPIIGSYRGASTLGLLWSEHLRTPGTHPYARGPVTELTVAAHGRTLASTHFTQLIRGPGVTVRPTTLAAEGFVGEYFAPPGNGHQPAVTVWGGSEGGDGDTATEAALLASHGIPTLAVAYFDAPGLPCRLQHIPLEYFARATRWLREQPQVDPRRVWILSGSRGTEAELLVAAHWPDLVHGVVAEATGGSANRAFHGTCAASYGAPAWSFDGRGVPDGTPLGPGVKGPVMLVTGGADAVWPSQLQADQVMMALPHDGAAHVHLNYPGAGHIVLADPSLPTADSEGGTVAANEAAHASDWPAMLRFIAGH
jgi:dienelactone hydrolase